MSRRAQAILLRAIFQARYKPELSYFSRADAVAQQLQKDYPIWRRDPDVNIQLSDYEHRCVLNVSHEALGFAQDSNDRGLLGPRVSRAVEQVSAGLQISEFKRLGLRQLSIVPVQMKFDSLAAIMSAKLLAQATRLKEALPARLDDLLYRVDATDGDEKFHITIAPVKREEISGKIINLRSAGTIDPAKLSDAIREAATNYPEVSIYFDVDVYRASMTADLGKTAAFVKAAEERIGRLISEVVDYLLETTVQK